jgi:hypothetical protein
MSVLRRPKARMSKKRASVVYAKPSSHPCLLLSGPAAKPDYPRAPDTGGVDGNFSR